MIVVGGLELAREPAAQVARQELSSKHVATFLESHWPGWFVCVPFPWLPFQWHWLVFTFRRFFQAACDVPELQDKFNVDEYSDLVTLTKPVIYISIGEIINTHTVSAFP